MESQSYTNKVDLCERIVQLINTDKYGVYHISNAGSCSWYELANSIFENYEISINVIPVKSDFFQSDAPRPFYSVLSDRALVLNGFSKMRHWKDALLEFLTEIKSR